MGLLLVVGSVMTLTTSLVLLPTLMRLRGERGRSPALAQHANGNGAAGPARAPSLEPVAESLRARHSTR